MYLIIPASTLSVMSTFDIQNLEKNSPRVLVRKQEYPDLP